MSSLDKSVNDLLNKMQQHQTTEKGTFGEQAVFRICEEFYRNQGGILYHSYSYKVDKSLPGNIKEEDGKLYIENLGEFTEIDVM